jgi:hypothetical protein
MMQMKVDGEGSEEFVETARQNDLEIVGSLRELALVCSSSIAVLVKLNEAYVDLISILEKRLTHVEAEVAKLRNQN